MHKLLISLSLKLNLLATKRNILILLAIWIVIQVILISADNFIKAESSGQGVLDLAFGFSAETAYSEHLDKYSEAARSLYLKVECLDLLYPICYGLLFSCLISLGFSNTKWHSLNLLPIITIFFDYLENIGIFSMLLSYPEKLVFMATWASVFSAIKWIFVVCTILAILASLAKIAITKVVR